MFRLVHLEKPFEKSDLYLLSPLNRKLEFELFYTRCGIDPNGDKHKCRLSSMYEVV